jgi:C-terminal processing protease CtpA/Prc
MKQLAWSSVVIATLHLFACGGSGGGGDDPNAECAKNWKNRYVYELLQDTYLWYDQVEANVDYTVFSSPGALLESVIPPIDRWSYINTAEDFYDYYEEGKFYGMGCSVEFDRDKKLLVRFVYQGSPADDAWIKRSDEIRSINGRSVSSITDLEGVWDEIYRHDTAEVGIRTKTGFSRTEILESDWVTINTVLYREVIDIGDLKAG